MIPGPSAQQYIWHRYMLWGAITGVLFIIDIASKQAIQNAVVSFGYQLSDPGLAVCIKAVFPGFDLVFVKNFGVSFGLFNNIDTAFSQQWILSGLAFLITGYFVYMVKEAQSMPMIWGLGLICSGALGNAFSRLRDGYVTDFIDLYINLEQPMHWPAFNIADICITVGATCYFIGLLRHERKQGKTRITP